LKKAHVHTTKKIKINTKKKFLNVALEKNPEKPKQMKKQKQMQKKALKIFRENQNILNQKTVL
jgi:hypothetical protein